MSSLSKRNLALTEQQWTWLRDETLTQKNWIQTGDSTLGYQFIENLDLGIKASFSFATGKFHIEVTQ